MEQNIEELQKQVEEINEKIRMGIEEKTAKERAEREERQKKEQELYIANKRTKFLLIAESIVSNCEAVGVFLEYKFNVDYQYIPAISYKEPKPIINTWHCVPCINERSSIYIQVDETRFPMLKNGSFNYDKIAKLTLEKLNRQINKEDYEKRIKNIRGSNEELQERTIEKYGEILYSWHDKKSIRYIETHPSGSNNGALTIKTEVAADFSEENVGIVIEMIQKINSLRIQK